MTPPTQPGQHQPQPGHEREGPKQSLSVRGGPCGLALVARPLTQPDLFGQGVGQEMAHRLGDRIGAGLTEDDQIAGSQVGRQCSVCPDTGAHQVPVFILLGVAPVSGLCVPDDGVATVARRYFLCVP